MKRHFIKKPVTAAVQSALPRKCSNCANRYDGPGMCSLYEYADCEGLPDPAPGCKYYAEDPKRRPEYDPDDYYDPDDRPYGPGKY